MGKLELKHIAPYLPYGISCEFETLADSERYLLGKTFKRELLLLDLHYFYRDKLPMYDYIKPILRPLSDLTKEIEVNGERFVPLQVFEKINKTISFYQPLSKDMDLQIDIETENYSQCIDLFEGYLVTQKLFEWHFDVFGLIQKGLAIDINTI